MHSDYPNPFTDAIRVCNLLCWLPKISPSSTHREAKGHKPGLFCVALTPSPGAVRLRALRAALAFRRRASKP